MHGGPAQSLRSKRREVAVDRRRKIAPLAARDALTPDPTTSQRVLRPSPHPALGSRPVSASMVRATSRPASAGGAKEGSEPVISPANIAASAAHLQRVLEVPRQRESSSEADRSSKDVESPLIMRLAFGQTAFGNLLVSQEMVESGFDTSGATNMGTTGVSQFDATNGMSGSPTARPTSTDGGRRSTNTNRSKTMTTMLNEDHERHEPVHRFAERELEALRLDHRLSVRIKHVNPSIIDRFHGYAAVIDSIAARLPQVGPTLKECIQEMRLLGDEFAEEKERREAAETELARFQAELNGKIETVKAECHREIKGAVRGISDRDDEIFTTQRTAELFKDRILELEAALSDAEIRINNREKGQADQSRELNMKRAMLKELQSKANSIVKENRYLREICMHNEDLLREVDSLKEAAQLQKETKDAQIARIGAELREALELKAGYESQMKHMKVLITHLQEEVGMLRRAHNETQALLDATRVQRDNYVADYTPRPHRDDPMLAIQGAADAIELQSSSVDKFLASGAAKLPSRQLVSMMTESLDVISQKFHVLKAKHAMQSQIIDYVKDDDYERLLGIQTQSTQVGDLGEAVEAVPAAKSAEATRAIWTERSFPMHSRVVVGSAMLDPKAPLEMQFTGLVPARSMGLLEVLATIDAFWKERYAALEAVKLGGVNHPELHRRLSISDFLMSFLAAKAPHGPHEFAAGFHHSLKLCCYAPQVELFNKILEGSAPEMLYRTALECVDVTTAALRVLASKTTGFAEKKRRFVKRRALLETLQLCIPAFTEADMLRLRGIISSECTRHGYGDGSSGTMKLPRDDLPLEMLLDGTTKDTVNEVAILGAQKPTSNSSLLSPFLAGLFRQVVLGFDMYRQDVLMGTTKLVLGHAPPSTPVSNDISPGAMAIHVPVQARASQFLASSGETARVLSQQLAEAVKTTDPTKPEEEVDEFVKFVFATQPLEITDAEAMVPFNDFLYRASNYVWFRHGEPPRQPALVVPHEPEKLQDISRKGLVGMLDGGK